MIMMNATSTLPPPPAAAPPQSPLSPPPPPLHHPPPPPPPPTAEAAAKARIQEREALRHVIAQWNANRLDLFELSEPNEELEFHGVMRFYFQDSGQKVATKCIRVASSAPATAVVETLIEKFRPDMRMLSVPEYALYEIHENGDERRLAEDEKPLLVQLNWHKDDREGRFLLRRIDDKTNVPAVSFQEGGSSFRRKLSKREKKQLKKQEKMNKLKGTGGGGSIGSGGSGSGGNENDAGVAEKLYTELPETSFTRSISNPEAVMRRRRQQKLERKLQQFRSKDGGPDTGGTLKIYGESLCRDVPYKTLLLSVRDTAADVVREMLSKYGLTRVDPSQYCLIQVNVLGPDNGGESSKEYHGSTNREYILDDDECPLAILMNHPSSRGSIMFHVRRRPADYHPRKRKKKPQQGQGQKGGGKGGGDIGPGGSSSDLLEYRRYEDSYDRLPFLLELNPDGSDIVNGIPKRHRLQLNATEVGSERSSQGPGGSGGVGGGRQSLQLFGPNVQPRHCVVAHNEDIVSVTPCSRDAETYVNGQRIYETTILHNGAVVKFGRIHNFRFIDPSYEDRLSRQRHDSSRQGYDYSDRQSNKDESILHGGSISGVSGSQGNFETTFDVDGHVETVSSASSSKLQQQQDPDSRSQRSVGSREGNRSSSNYERYPPMQTQPQPIQRPPTATGGGDPILPAALEFREEATDALLDALVTSLDPPAAPPHFRLAPTYALYLAARFRASTHYRPELTPTERAHRLTALLARVAAMIRAVVQERYGDAESLAFWMANASELLHFLKSDRHISAFSLDAQDILAEAVQIAFRNLVSCLQADLGAVMMHFLADRDDDRNEEESAGSVLQVLASAMALLRRCRVNAALTIQLFSQLFHYVNVWAFNRVVASAVASGSANSPTSPHHHTHHHHPHMHPHHHRPSYCSREWGLRLGARLARVEAWAERQGLELAADCHLSRIAQAAHLLQAPKYNAEDLCAISTACFKLNSLQLRALLTNYQHAPDEPRIPLELVENVVRVAENVCDDLVRNEGREVRLEEEEGELLRLPFLLPDDGYSCDVVRGLPPGLVELLAPLQRANICRLVPQHTSAGFWTVYMTPPPSAMLQHTLSAEPHQHSQASNFTSHGPRSPSALSNRSGGMDSSSSRLHGSVAGHPQGQLTSPQPHLEPETQVIKLHKSNNGMGLSIVAAKGAGQDRLGIYIKSVVKGGAADADGRLQAGDQLLKVDGQSLVGITQEKAAEYLVRTGPVVTLEVAKQGAIYHGLATLLSQPSPVMTRAHRPYSVHQDWGGARGWDSGGSRNVSSSRPLSYIPPSTSLPQLAQLRPPLPYQQKSRNTLQHVPRGERSGDWNRIPTSVSAHSISGAPRLVVFSPTTPLLVISQACVSDDTLSSSPPVKLSIDDEGDEVVDIYNSPRIPGNSSAYPARTVPSVELSEDVYRENRIPERSILPKNPPNPNQPVNREICSRCHCRSSGYPRSGDGGASVRSGGGILKKRVISTADCGTNTEEEDFLDDYEESENLCSWPDADCWVAGGGGGRGNVSPPERSSLSKLLANRDEDEEEEEESWKSKRNLKTSECGKDSRAEERHNNEGVRDRFDDNDLASETGDSISSDDTDLLTSARITLTERGFRDGDEDDWYKSDGNLSKSFETNSKGEATDDVLKSWSDGDITADFADTPGIRKAWDGMALDGAPRWFKSWRSPREVRMGCGKVAALARHFASLGGGGLSYDFGVPNDSQSGWKCGIGRTGNASLSKSMPDISQIDHQANEEEEEEHGECGWKRGLLPSSRIQGEGDDALEEIGYRLLYATLSSDRKGKALRFLSGPLGSRPRSEDNLMALSMGPTESLEVETLSRRKCVPLHLSWECEKPKGIRPRRMSERDLPSKVQGEHNHTMGERGRMGGLPPPHMPAMHGSKSVPSLNSGHGDVGAMTIGAPQQTTVGGASPPGQGSMRQHPQHSQMQQHQPPQQLQQQQQPSQPNHVHSHHEVYNPGYSRTSSTNSIPQKSSGYDGLRSRSSQNLSEPRSPGAVPPQGLGARQASNPGLTGLSQQQPHAQHHQFQPQQQPGGGQPPQQAPNASQQGAEAERFYQNLSIYRSQQPEPQGHNGFAPPSPNRGKLPSPQGPNDERGPQATTKPTLRGSQSSLHRQLDIGNGSQGTNGARDRPVSAYIPQNGPQPVQQSVPRSQSARDVLRQEAKLHEMQEEVRRRREGRPGGGPLAGPSGLTSPPQQQYQLGHPHSRSHPQLPQQRGPNTTYPQNSGYPEGAQHSPNHHHHPNPQAPSGAYPSYHNPNAPAHGSGYPPFSPTSGGQYPPTNAQQQQQQQQQQQMLNQRNPPPTAPKPRPSHPPTAGGPQRPPSGAENIEIPPARPPPPDDVYRDSPPPPPPPTSTHPLYQSGAASPGQKPPAASNQQNEGRYNASAGEPPKGSFYPSSSSSQGQSRQFPFAAMNPWDREEKEKEEARRREAARQWRDRQISELEALGPGGRGPGQEERLRALRLEREFQRRAEEEEARRGKRGEEEDEEEEEDDEEDGDGEEKGGEVVEGGGGRESGIGGGDRTSKHDGSAEHVVVGNGNEGEEHNGNIEDSREARPAGGLLRMVASPEEQDYNPARRPGNLEVSNGPLRSPQVMHQQEEDLNKKVHLQHTHHHHQGNHPQNQQPMQNQNHQAMHHAHYAQHALHQQQSAVGGPNRQSMPSPSHQVPGNQMLQSQGYGQPHGGRSQQPGPLRLDNLVVNGGVGGMSGGQSPSTSSPRHNGHHGNLHNYQDGPSPGGPYSPSPQGGMGSQQMGSGSQRLDSLLSMGPASPSTPSGGLSPGAPAPPERGSSFVIMSQQQQVHSTSSVTGGGVLRNANGSSSVNQSSSSMSSSSLTTTTTTTTPKRVSFHDSKVVTFDDNANHQERSTVREDPNNFINEAQTMLATPRSPDGSFTGNTPGVIGAQEVYRDPRTRRLAEQQKLLVNRTGPLPEKLSFKEKMKMFAMETGEDGTPKDKVKISRAQRDIEGPVPPNGYGPN